LTAIIEYIGKTTLSNVELVQFYAVL